MNKFITVAGFLVLASPAFAQGMAAPSGGQPSGGMSSSDSMAGPSPMASTHGTMKMDHKAKKTAMKHGAMSGGMTSGDKMAAPSGGMASGSMSGPNH